MKQPAHNRVQKSFLITFIIVTIAAIAVSSAVITTFFNNAMTEREFRSQRQALHAGENSIQQMNSEAKQLLMMFSNLKTVKNLLNNGVSEEELKSYIISLSESHVLLENSPSIVMYLIDYNRSLVYTVYYSEYTYSFDEFFDREILEEIRTADTSEKFRPHFRTVPYSDYRFNPNVISYYYFEGARASYANTAIVINIDREWLENQFAIECASGESIHLYDAESGQLLCSSADTSAQVAAAGMQTIAEQTLPEGSITFRIDEKNTTKFLLSYYPLEQEGFTIAKITDYQNILSAMSQVWLITAGIILLLLLLGVLAAWAVSSRLFVKVDRELKKKYYKPHSFSLQEIYNGISTVDYLTDNSVQQLADQFAATHGIAPTERIFLALFVLDDPADPEGGIQSIQYAIIRELSGIRKIFVNATVRKDMLLAVVQAAPDSPSPGSAFETLLLRLAEDTGVSLSVYHSTVGSPASLTSMIFDLKVLRESKFLFDPGSVVSTETADQLEEADADVPISLTEELSLLIYSEQYAQLYDTVNHQIFEKRWDYNVHSIRETLNMLSNSLQSALYHKQRKLMVNYSAIIKEVSALPKQPHILAAREALRRITEKLTAPEDPSAHVAQNKQQGYIEAICRLIEENYQDYNFSSKTIADTLNLSNLYVCRIFKNAKNESLHQFINAYRIERAAELLRTTSLSAQEISKRCGLYNANYFYTLFKKYMGITASEYKRSCRTGKE